MVRGLVSPHFCSGSQRNHRILSIIQGQKLYKVGLEGQRGSQGIVRLGLNDLRRNGVHLAEIPGISEKQTKI